MKTIMKNAIVISFLALSFVSCNWQLKQSNELDGLFQSADTVFSGLYDIPLYFGLDTCHSEIVCGTLTGMPKMDGLTYMTTGRFHVGVKCPDNQVLLGWVSEQLESFLQQFSSCSQKAPSERTDRQLSQESLVKNIISQLTESDSTLHPSPRIDPEVHSAILLTPVCQVGDYYTIQRDTWEVGSGVGNHTRKEWFSINIQDGNVLKPHDVIRAGRKKNLSDAILKHLAGAGGLWIECHSPEHLDFFNMADGCALLPDSILFYFNPYAIGSGAEGYFTSCIPYTETKKLIRIKQ